ncbi:hypothetical protein H0266_15450 [Halobacillus locisalis]|uniref:VOC domain-containing protein n=1 Tax=Halobacillus locisalis TaxID=220753 RepID=A0A838CWK3_9BACI|nr:hypothetical protein [Halobacillus locisalis]MBA2176293.1 hypothetical protein [Halobacillus locisalis]
MARVRRFESDFPSAAMRIHHIGWSVDDLAASIRLCENLGFDCVITLEMADEVMAFMENGAILIELIESSHKEPLHFCFAVEEIDQTSKSLGLSLIGGPYTIPQMGWVSYFFEARDGVSVELLKPVTSLL